MPTVAEIESPKYRISSLAVDMVVFVDIGEDDLPLFVGWSEERPGKRGPNPTEPGLYVLGIIRLNPPYQGLSYRELQDLEAQGLEPDPDKTYKCLPGGFVDYNEDPNDAAPRELREETHLPESVLPDVTLVGIYGQKNRDPRRHVVSCGFSCLLRPELAREAYGGDDAKETWLLPVNPILSGDTKMGFDHQKIIADAYNKLARR